MYVHMEEAGSKSNHILINTQGAELIASVDYDIYGIYEFKNTVYVVAEKVLYEFDDDLNAFNNVGAVDFNREVSISDNGISIMMVGGNGYAYTPDTGVLKDMSTEVGWFPSDTVTYMDGYFIFNRTDTGQFFISKLYSTELDPIDWASAESAPDDTIAVIVSNRQLWLFGERSTEVWYDSGDIDFPFTRISGAVTDIGCSNHQTVAKIRDNLFFVGNDFKVYMTNGYTPAIVSTPAIEKRLFDSDPLTLFAFTFVDEGHWFYALTIDNKYTYVYDKDTAQWHRRTSKGLDRWFINGTINRFYSNDLVGYSGKDMHLLSIDILTENNDRIRREAVSLPLNDGVNRFILAECQLDMEVGFDKVDAEVTLQLSDDGGVTWSNNHYTRTGAIGENRTRVRWLRLGQHRDCILKVVITDAIPIRMLGLYARFR